MSVRVEVQPSVLVWARARSGIDDETWVARFPRYEAWLEGEATPTLKQLEGFARKTHTPVGFLFLDEPPVEPVPIPDFRTVGDRPVGASEVVSADLLDVIYACERRQEWYRDNQILEGEPPLPFVGVATTNDAIVDVASQMREVLDWTAQSRSTCRTADAALTWLREHAEAVGVLVMISGVVGSNTYRKLDAQEFRGFALVDQQVSVVFVNGSDSKAAQVFTLAHELAHLWLGQPGLCDLEPDSLRENVVERWCTDVAAEFVGPIVGGGESRCAATRGICPRPAVGQRFARAVMTSALEGRTSYTAAFRLLDLKRASAFDRLADRLGFLNDSADLYEELHRTT